MLSFFFQIFTALGNALFSSFWQMGVIWVAIVIIEKTNKKISTSGIGLIQFAGLSMGFLAFIITFVFSLFTPQTETAVLQWVLQQSRVSSVLYTTSIIYLALLFIPLKHLAANFLYIQILKKKSTGRVPGSLKIFMLDNAAYLGIKRKIKLYTSSLISSPLTIGFLKPVILLPVALISQLSPQQLEVIILHELAHIKRNDYLLNFIMQAMLAVLYFNPFARAIAKAHELNREKSADNWVMRFQYGQYMYADTLLHIAKNNMAIKNKLILEASRQESPLMNRVKTIMGMPQQALPQIKRMAFVITISVFSLFFYLVHDNNAKQDTAAVSKSFQAIPIQPGKISFATNKADEVNNNSLYKIRQIPAITKIEKTNKPPANLYYLKEYENNTTGTIEAPIKITPNENGIVLIDHPAVIIPVLDKEAEHKVAQSIEKVKQIVMEMNWKQLEKSLGETVTTKQKILLKQQFAKLMNTIDWQVKANELRMNYNNIDWQKVNNDFQKISNTFYMDSIRTHYTTVLPMLQEAQKKLHNSRAKADSITAIINNEKINTIKKFLSYADSLNASGIIEL